MREYKSAIVQCDLAIEIDPECVNLYNHKGLALYNLGEFKNSIVQYDLAILLNPKNQKGYNNKGNSLFALGIQ